MKRARLEIEGQPRAHPLGSPAVDVERAVSLAFDNVCAAFARDPRVGLPAASRRGFGAQTLKVDGRIFAMLAKGALVVKLPRDRVSSLIDSGEGIAFDANKGRPMKEWVAIPLPPVRWLAFAREARAFVGA